MKIDSDHRSRDVEDRRGQLRAPGGLGAGTVFQLFRFASRFGWKGILGAGVLVGGVMLYGAYEAQLSSGGGTDAQAGFVAGVLDDVQATWDTVLPGYRHARLVLFRGSTTTACGYGDAATGPFYCPSDEQVYIDLGFYDDLAARFGAPGDFAQAYVIAHEIGHHVQHLLGDDAKVPARGAEGASGASVRLELQADCYAGIWAAQAEKRGLLEPGDLEEGLRAAAAIGDDRLQRGSGGAVAPESFTHGTSEQRVRWLKRGYDQGELAACDTFGATAL